MEMELEGGSNGQETEARAPPPPALPWMVQLQLYIIVAVGRIAMSRSGTVHRRFFSAVDRPARTSARQDKNGVRSADVTVDASRGLWARVFSPSQASAPLPVLVYFHGGAFTLLSASSIPYDDMCRRFCHGLGAVVVSVNYRLAPEHRCPAAYDDGVDVLRHLASAGLPDDVAVPVDLSRCFLAGDSAGGNIVHHVAQRWTGGMAPSSPTILRLAGAILIQPFFGGEARTGSEERLDGKAWVVTVRDSDWAWRAFLPEGADRNHPAAHVTDESADLADGFPPAMVVVGGLDPLQDWQRQYAGVLDKKGKVVQLEEFDEAIHGFFWFPELPETGKLTAKMKAFMESSA
ncbi:probable carboxylesterase 18 [Miscanthus floridulus]|uniref:probable carboxylesterase 18 n=1 Tax=Miscanthus floridulus TaxID=154761 RepID=UPI00345A1806